MSRRDSCTRQHPCPACGHPQRGKTAHCHWISGRNGPRSGVWCANMPTLNGVRGEPSGGGGWRHWLTPLAARAAYVPAAKPEQDAPRIDYTAHTRRWTAACTTAGPLAHLAGKLKLQPWALAMFRVGWAKSIDGVIDGTDTPYRGDGVWTFPMTDGVLSRSNPYGAVLGVRVRTINGDKFSLRNPLAGDGLFVPTGVTSCRGGLLLLPEGPTSATALCQLGFVAVGRPNNRAGLARANSLIHSLAPRTVVLVGDNDQRFNDKLGRNEWPGRDGAIDVAAGLRHHDVRLILPPPGIKDARAWLHAGAVRVDVAEAIEHAERFNRRAVG